MRPSSATLTALALAVALASAPTALTGLTKARADLAVRLAETPDPVGIGRAVTYTLTVTNAGPSRASAPILAMALPSGAEVGSVIGRSCASGGGKVTCKLPSLRKGARVVVKIEAKATAVGSLAASATVSAKTSDPRRRNNSATQTTRVLGLDTVTGHGARPVFNPFGPSPFRVSVDIDASSAFDGTDAAGTFATRYPNGDPDLRGRVVCLTVSGNRAMIGGIVESASGSNPGANPPGSGVLLAVTDNGEPGPGQDTEISYLGVENARSCAIQEAGSELALTEGNFTVHDERP